MKTISLELSKRISKGGYLDGIETEYIFREMIWRNGSENTYNIYRSNTKKSGRHIKTLTLEEAIEFLPVRIDNNIIQINKIEEDYLINYSFGGEGIIELKGSHCSGKTLLEAIECILEYLLDNNLLGKQD